MIATIIYITLFILFTIPLFFGLIVLWLFTALFDKKRIAVQTYSKFWSLGIYKLCPWWKMKISGQQNIRPEEQYIILSNHQQMLDIPLILHLPLNFRFVSKREVYKIPIFGAVLYMRDDVAIERGGPASAKKMINDCKKYFNMGVSVAIFPEGTRTTTGEINDFHSGAFLLAKRAGVPILPVVINGNYDAFAGGKIAKKHTFSVDILPAVSVETIESLTMDELKELLEQTIKTQYKEVTQ